MSAEKEPMPQRQLGELMTELGLISDEQLATVLEVQQQSNRPLGQIIVELGFASGAAVAHALAMQSGGALRTEYGFALGLQPADADAEETRAGLPKLRLAATAVVPPERQDLEPPEDVETEDSAGAKAVEEHSAVAEPAETESVEEAEPSEETPLAVEPEADPPALAELRAEIDRLEAALADVQAAREHELRRLEEERAHASAELERLQSTLAETQTEHEQELTRLHEERDQAAAELERLQTALDEAQGLATEHERRLVEAQDGQSAERDELAAQRDRIKEELDDALERLAGGSSAAEERDRLRVELEQFEARTREELDNLQTALAEAQTSVADQERRLGEERELHAAERSELTAQRDRLQEELGDALEKFRTLGTAAEERDELRAELERLEATLGEVQESCAIELRGALEERDNLTAELEEAREMLRQAERVRESQIALEAERDRAVAELERLRTVAAETQAEAEEQARLLAEEQDRQHAERESLVAQRSRLEDELGSAIEQLAAVATAADEREAQLQLGTQRLLQALDAVRGLAAELVPGIDPPPEEPVIADAEAEPGTDGDRGEEEHVADVPDSTQSEPESEAIDYSLFVPGPNGYELVPQTGVPPQAGQRVELVFPDRDEPAVFDVVRTGRTLPDGDVCVYLAQV
jgi:hypothetical protein